MDVDRAKRAAAGSRSLVLRLIRANGALSRVELAALTGLTVAAMTNVTRDLLLDGLIEEAGNSGNTGGKPRTLLRIRGASGYAIGVSVDLNSLRVVLVDYAGAVVAALPAVESANRVPELAARVGAQTREVVRRAGVREADVVGVGVAGQGPHERAAEPAPGPYADQWLDRSIGPVLAEELQTPVVLQNDANAVAVGEFSRSLDARASGNFACVFLGESGLGSGIFLDGQLVLGSNSYAGAIAHLSMDVNGPACFCGSQGCLELYSTPRAMVDSVRLYDSISTNAAVGVSSSGAVMPSDLDVLYAAARNGHSYAVDQVGRAARYIASAAATMGTLLDLDLIVLAGAGFSGMEAAYLEAARDVANRFKRAGARRDFAVRFSGLGPGNEAAAVGAALGVLERAASMQRNGISREAG